MGGLEAFRNNPIRTDLIYIFILLSDFILILVSLPLDPSEGQNPTWQRRLSPVSYQMATVGTASY